ncbi:MAG: cyclase family protein [Gemmatimonadota bacterium]
MTGWEFVVSCDAVRIIDISQAVGAGIAVWPGDQPYELEWTLRQDRGDSVNVAALTLSVHTGTHTDGGFHVTETGSRPFQLPLDAYIGKALVLDVRGRPALDERVIDDVDLTTHRRILFRTRDAVDAREFPASFLAPAPALARRLVAAGVRLIGSDAPSMDDVDSKTLESHRILADGGVATLENLVLTDVAPGTYTLIALPLKLVDADSSPVRAVLIEGEVT